jgi:hypothetical protein
MRDRTKDHQPDWRPITKIIVVIIQTVGSVLSVWIQRGGRLF